MSKTVDWNFAELTSDEKFTSIVKDFDGAVDEIERQLAATLELRESSQLSLNDAIKLDSYLTYLLNTLYWIHLKLQGVDVKEHPVNHEIARTRDYITRDKAIDAGESAPRLDVPAVRRFISRGMHVRFDEHGEVEKQHTKNDKN